MKSNINLALIKKSSRAQKKILFVAFFIFLLSFLAGGGVVIYYYQLQSQLSDIENEKISIQQRINNDLNKKRADIFLLKDRLHIIGSILKSRTDINSKVKAIVRLLPNSIAIDSVSAKSSEISLDFISSDLVAINELLEEKIKTFPQSQAGGVKKIDLTAFSIDEKRNAYTFSLTFIF